MEATLIIIILLIVLVLSNYLSHLERKDLLNRIMARNLEDLRVNTQKDESNEIVEEEDDTIPLEEAQEEIEEQLNG